MKCVAQVFGLGHPHLTPPRPGVQLLGVASYWALPVTWRCHGVAAAPGQAMAKKGGPPCPGQGPWAPRPLFDHGMAWRRRRQAMAKFSNWQHPVTGNAQYMGTLQH